MNASDSSAPDNTCTSPSDVITVVNHEKYYFDDDPMVIFLVENCHFKVHRHFLIQGSELFRDMFKVTVSTETQATSNPVEGLSNDRPIVLPEVTIPEFTALLDCFYLPRHIPRIPGHDTLQYSLDLLSVSHRFLFDGIYRHTLQGIIPVDIPVMKRLELGEKYVLKDWCFSAYRELVERAQMITEVEAQAFPGQDRILKLAYAREELLQEKVRSLEYDLSLQKESPRRRGSTWAQPRRTSVEFLLEKYFFPVTPRMSPVTGSPTSTPESY